MRGATDEGCFDGFHFAVSIHAPRAGRDSVRRSGFPRTRSFNPRAPCGARHPHRGQWDIEGVFQSTRPVRGATCVFVCGCGRSDVSIHAPRAGRDTGGRSWLHRRMCFNPRAPCGARRGTTVSAVLALLFQSTRPVRGATQEQAERSVQGRVSIHAPRAGRDRGNLESVLTVTEFQSTRPVRGATAVYALSSCRIRVSIHAPRAGRDPRRRAAADVLGVSIHAPRAGRDPPILTPRRRTISFNPRAPCGARRRPA